MPRNRIASPNQRSVQQTGYGIAAATLVSFLLLGCGAAQPHAPSVKEDYKLSYPETHRGDDVDDYHGHKVADPYRWLEDPNSPATTEWVQAQNNVTFGYLNRLPARDRFRERLTELWNFERYGLPRKRGQRYFYERNSGLQNQAVLYVVDSLDGQPRVLLDPNELSADGTVDLAGWEVSDDGKHLAYGLGHAGSDWHEWKVLEIETGQQLLDNLKWVKFSGVSWRPDGKGFYYSRYDEPAENEQFTAANYYQKLYYHPLGEPQYKDTLVYQRQDQKEWGFDGHVTEDGHYLIITVWRGTERKNQVFYQDLNLPGSPVIELLTGFDAEFQFLGNEGPLLWLATDADAPLRRVVAIDIERPERKDWRVLIPAADQVLESVSVVGDRFFATYLKDASSLVKIFDLEGRQTGDVELPAIGSAGGFQGRRDETETFFSFTNFTTPPTIFRYDIPRAQSEVFRRPELKFKPEDYQTRQVFFTSRDGTRVPMFVTHKTGLVQNGDNPTLLYGYGGFDISLTPGFSVSNLAWIEAGGVYAVPNLRGGGEYGRPWHEAGMNEQKQNVFDDFLAAAQWLIDEKYTSPRRLAIRGRSNGGLLVGAAMTQRPDLFAVALPGVGVLDMLRYHKFTIGHAWVSEFGSADDPDEFRTLFAYSPLHNLQPGTRYPATLVTTADHDDRVVPAHSFKFAAALQAAQVADGPPVLIRIETSGGHGAGRPIAKVIQEEADSLAFAWSILDAAD